MPKNLFGSLVLLGACMNPSVSENQQLAQLSGAIFTTTADGDIVNENTHYGAKTDVYLDGGPGPGAPASAACLPAGPYYFMVTDPPGHTLLSTDDIGCRRFLVTETCTIGYAPESCAAPHVTGTDVDHGGDTIQLMPYLDTPNNGGEYKAWATPTSAYSAGNGTFGFLHADSKTDNYKVRNPEDAPVCGDGVVDVGEECDDGNDIDDDACTNDCKPCPPVEEPVCGNGVVEGDEQCDDGNTNDNDTCSNACEICVPALQTGKQMGKRQG